MTTLPRSLAMQQVTIAIFLILAVFQAYLSFSSPAGLSLRGVAMIGSPLGSMLVVLAEYPKFKLTAARIPMNALGLAIAISSVYILFTY